MAASGRRTFGQPVFIGGSMGTALYVLAGVASAEPKAFASACHGAGRAMSRHAALKRFSGRQIIDALAEGGVLIRSPSSRGVAEEARPLQGCERGRRGGGGRRPRPSRRASQVADLRQGMKGQRRVWAVGRRRKDRYSKIPP